MALNFPSTPTLNQVYTFNGRSWICVSTSPVQWQAISAGTAQVTPGKAIALAMIFGG